MSDLIKYTVCAGETWTSVAFKAYGDAKLTEPIIAANPRVPVTERLPQGLVLYIPILSADDNLVTPIEALPPWQ